MGVQDHAANTEGGSGSMAADGMQFPWRWYGGMISANLEVIWEMSDKSGKRMAANVPTTRW